MMIFSKKRAVLFRRTSGLVLALLTSTGIAQAQEAGQGSKSSGDESSEEIVVTALKGNVSIQKAPVTVNIVSGAAIADRALTSAEQLTTAVPGIRINQAPGGTINPVVRGLGSSPSNNSFEQTVGLFVDGIFAGHPRDYSAALFDLERVELLKGTQAAVVGKNTSVGALALVTRKPSFDLGGEVSYYREFNLDSVAVNAAVNVPLSESIAFRVAGLHSDEGGWMKQAFGGADVPSVSRRAIRGTLRIQPSSAIDWTLSAQYSEQKQAGQIFKVGFDALGNAAAQAGFHGDPAFSIQRYVTRGSDRPGFSYRGLNGLGQETDGTRFNSTLTYDLGSVTLSSITGYSEFTDTYLIDAISTRNAPALRGGYERDKSFSQELRVATNGISDLSVIAGLYYYHDNWFYEDSWDFLALPAGPVQTGGAYNNNYRQKTNTISAFGQLQYDLTDQLKLSVSGRYEHFKKSGKYSARTVTRAGDLTNNVYGAYPAFSRSNSDDFFDYAAQVQYFLNPSVNLYASYSTGTKGFGFVANPTASGGVPREPFFNNEESSTIEAGVKARFMQGSHINLAFFRTRLKNYQIGVNLGPNFLIRNDQIRSQGVEGSLDLSLMDGLSASVTATYADVKKLPPLPANPSIATLPFAPKLSGIASVTLDTPVAQDFQLKGNLSVEFRSSQVMNDVPTVTGINVPARARTDLRLGVEYKPAKFELALVARNIFDVYAYSYMFSQFGATGATQVAEEMPRTIALQGTVRF